MKIIEEIIFFYCFLFWNRLVGISFIDTKCFEWNLHYFYRGIYYVYFFGHFIWVLYDFDFLVDYNDCAHMFFFYILWMERFV